MLTRTHAAFLRAINTGGRRVSMDALRAAFAPLGYHSVATWQATGNVAFATDAGADVVRLERRISEVLQAELGWEVPTIVRTAAQVLAIATDVPFTPRQVEETEGRVQVMLVRDEPSPAAIVQALAHATADDELQWAGRELWWLPRTTVGDSVLRVGRIEAALGVTTMRTHHAVVGLVAKHLA